MLRSSRPFDQLDVAPVYCVASRRADDDKTFLSSGENIFVAKLHRRGVHLGTVWQSVARTGSKKRPMGQRRLCYYRKLWDQPFPFVIEQALSDKLRLFKKKIARSLKFLDRIRSSESAAKWLEKEPYASRLMSRFDIVCTTTDLIEDQEIEKVYLNAVSGRNVLAEDLFIKVNYLSSYPRDLSLRLRFSFGAEAFKSWKAWERDLNRSYWSSRLAQTIFPESGLIVHNTHLVSALEKILGHRLQFPERIVYSNAPNGGAFFHHDFVRSHVGVIFAQLYGITGWLALPKPELIASIKCFLRSSESLRSLERQFPRKKDRDELRGLANPGGSLEERLDDEDSGLLLKLINNNPEFIRLLVEKGAMRILRPGDVILLPAPSCQTATWHSVFCLDDRPGLSLSFAIKRMDKTNRS